MRIEIEKTDLIKLLSKTQNIVEKRNTMPVLVNVLLEAKDSRLKVFATDLEVSLTDEANCQVLEEGSVAVSAKSLFDIIKELPDNYISLHKKENNWLEVKQNKSIFNIVGISAEEYPVFPTYRTKEFTKISAEVLKDMIEKTIYSVSNDETRYHLNGVYFENVSDAEEPQLRMVSTDGHRLAMVERKTNSSNKIAPTQGVIIPRKGLNEIRKILDQTTDVEMAIEGSQLIVKCDNTVLMIRLIEGKYPNYKTLIPKTLSRHIRVSKDTLLSSLKRVSLLSNQKSKGITLNIQNSMMEISSNNPDLGDAKEEIEIDYKGENMKIGFNAKYLMDVLSNIDTEQVEIELNDLVSPALLHPSEDRNYRCVVMPMRF
mgnify:CR=1 FL=1|tara:strand:- start:2331 stop:3446 length:1116 start_codon:yes stop_codon:yes gene_type:complete